MGPLTSSGAVDKGPVDHLVAILRHKWLDDLWFLEKGRDSLAAAAPTASAPTASAASALPPAVAQALQLPQLFGAGGAPSSGGGCSRSRTRRPRSAYSGASSSISVGRRISSTAPSPARGAILHAGGALIGGPSYGGARRGFGEGRGGVRRTWAGSGALADDDE